MRTSALRAVAAAVALTLVAVGCGGDDAKTDTGADSTTTAETNPTDTTAMEEGTVIELVVKGGEIEGGSRRESAALGENVTIRVSGDTDDEVHIHGYDLHIDLVDGAGELTFPATIPGVFEVELEDAGTLLVQLEVS